MNWIQIILKTSKISVLVNGTPTKELSPTRGLRQGDPLSPLLFNLVGEVLAQLLRTANTKGLFKGVRMPSSSIELTHLQFADDVILFINNDSDSILGVKRVLQCFEILSGLHINFDKSSLYGFHEDHDQLVQWAEMLGCRVGFGPISYLGASIGTPSTSIKFWNPLLDKIEDRLQNLNSDNLSMAGRMVLLKSVVDSMPIFWFTLFRIPMGVLDKMEKLRRQFLWGKSTQNGQKPHLLNWTAICKPKINGGLGLGLLVDKNLTLLAKWWWRSYSERNSLWNRLLSETYGKEIHYNMPCVPRSNAGSSLLKSIISIKDSPQVSNLLDRSKFKWNLKNGEKIYFWEDVWHHNGVVKDQIPRLFRISRHRHISVRKMMAIWKSQVPSETMWSRPLMDRDESNYVVFNEIMTSISLVDSEDELCWLPGKGSWTTKNFRLAYYSSLFQEPHPACGWNLLWSVKVPPKIKVFLWKLQRKILPTNMFLGNRIQSIPTVCKWCNVHPESIDHIFWQCEVGKWAWNFICGWWGMNKQFKYIHSFSLFNLLACVKSSLLNKQWQLVVAVTCWTIWLARNEAQFSNKRISREVLEFLILSRTDKWGKATGCMGFGCDPLWRVNPQGAIALYNHRISQDYWKNKLLNYSTVCAVDGAWGLNINKQLQGGIGGNIKKQGHNSVGRLFFTFSGPIAVASSLDAEIEAIIYVLRLALNGNLELRPIVICSDSREAIEIIYKGLRFYSPVHGPLVDLSEWLNSKVFINYVPRDLNVDADQLARIGINKPSIVHFSSVQEKF